MDGSVQKKNVTTVIVINVVESWCIAMIAVSTIDRFWIGFIFGGVFSGGILLAITNNFYLGSIFIISSVYFTYEYLRKRDDTNGKTN